MNIAKLIVAFFTVGILIQSSAYITIDIDEDDFQQVNGFFNNIIINRAPATTTTTAAVASVRVRSCDCDILQLVSKFMCTVMQMLGIMLTLVASNLLTAKFSEIEHPTPVIKTVLQSGISMKNNSHVNINSTELCENNDFGCHRNLCWRSCKAEKERKKSSFTFCMVLLHTKNRQ